MKEKKTSQPLTGFSLYSISSKIEFLKRAGVGAMVVYENGYVRKGERGYILAVMQWTQRDLEEHGLAKGTIPELKTLIQQFKAKYSRKNLKLDELDQAKLSTLASMIDENVLSDLEKRRLVEVASGGLLNYPQLLSEGIRLLFSNPETTEKLDKIVRHDLRESVRCISFNICTASVMCSLRAVEGALRSLHKTLTSQKTELPWGPLSDGIKNLLQEKDIRSPELLGYLNGIRNIRNSADHPGKVFNRGEAEHALVTSANAIEEVCKLIEALGQKGD
jgi:hypothetical protein